jgi:hypothetical protein
MAETRWIPDEWDSSVYLHDVGDPNIATESVLLTPGSEIPEGVELGQHIPTTSVKPKSVRDRESTQAYQQELADAGDDRPEGASDFDPREHTVAEVTAYLQQNPGDAGRVFGLEEKGAKRAGILGGAAR